MSHSVTLDLPDHLATRARAEADRTARPVEAILVEWLERAGDESLESLSDEELRDACDAMMDASAHAEFSELLARSREGDLDEPARRRLSNLMTIYQQGLLRKARANRLAVARGIKPAFD